jgi:3'-phosphoadenosine 5'-phosphosulfate sulfotransferase (PAPS reductase)/FAD synthetase
MKKIIVSLSGGKDSLAVALGLLERGTTIHSAAFFDTGWEFPEVLSMIELFKIKTDIRVVHLHPWADFNYWLAERPVRKNNRSDGEIHRIGHGWPSHNRRWCTRMKVDAINRYARSIPDAVLSVGIAADEKHRVKEYDFPNVIWPLIDWNMTESDALSYCYARGYKWNGVYEWMPSKRVSCFCCPLQGKADLSAIRKHRPHLWNEILRMDASIAENRGFIGFQTADDLEREFEAKSTR